jgi:hypothetical protein
MRTSCFKATLGGVVLTVALAALAQPPAARPKTFNFEGDALGASPAGFEFARTLPHPKTQPGWRIG